MWRFMATTFDDFQRPKRFGTEEIALCGLGRRITVHGLRPGSIVAQIHPAAPRLFHRPRRRGRHRVRCHRANVRPGIFKPSGNPCPSVPLCGFRGSNLCALASAAPTLLFTVFVSFVSFCGTERRGAPPSEIWFCDASPSFVSIRVHPWFKSLRPCGSALIFGRIFSQTGLRGSTCRLIITPTFAERWTIIEQVSGHT
jgi:hypothetical protein